MERFFNTAGPNNIEDSYTLNPLARFDLDDIMTLIQQKRYFVLHAPRQTGKTSCMLALRDYLNAAGDYIAVYANVEGGQASRNDIQSVVKSMVDTLAMEVDSILNSSLAEDLRDTIQSVGRDSMLSIFLSKLSSLLPKPLVLILDEIDALVGDGLVCVLCQIRSGYANRPKDFLQNIICGVRDE